MGFTWARVGFSLGPLVRRSKACGVWDSVMLFFGVCQSLYTWYHFAIVGSGWDGL